MLYGEINRQRLKIINEHVVADTIDYLEARFAFSADWDGLEKWVHFAKDGEVYDIRLTDDCVQKEEHLNLSAGIWKVYLHGNEFAGGKVIERITTNAAILKVEPTGTLDGEPFPEIPASVTEQILARLHEVEQNGGGSGDGYSPEAKVERVEGGVRVTITDKDGTTSEVVQDGRPGVHVGSDAPPAGTRVWVNPNGKRTEIPRIDETLTQPGKAADAKAVGDKIGEVSKAIADKRTSAMWYGTTSTEPYTAEKVVTTETGDFKLIKGARVGVKFLTNTVNCNSLIVDGTEQVHIRSTNDEKGEAGSSSTETPIVWHNLGQVQWFTYDGEYFIVDDSVRATAANQLCGKVSVSDSVSSTGDTVASSTAVKTAYDKAVDALNAVTALDAALAATIGSGVVS